MHRLNIGLDRSDKSTRSVYLYDTGFSIIRALRIAPTTMATSDRPFAAEETGRGRDSRYDRCERDVDPEAVALGQKQNST